MGQCSIAKSAIVWYHGSYLVRSGKMLDELRFWTHLGSVSVKKDNSVPDGIMEWSNHELDEYPGHNNIGNAINNKIQSLLVPGQHADAAHVRVSPSTFNSLSVYTDPHISSKNWFNRFLSMLD
jgi:hypothetical protein